MIRHICMFKLNEENKKSNLEKILNRAQDLQAIEQIKRFEIVCNADGMPQSNYDIALIFDFLDAEELEAYQQHPIHKAFGAFIGPLRDLRACIDYCY